MSDAVRGVASDVASDAAADRALERGIARLLRVGMLLAAAITLAGGAILLLAHGGEPANLAAGPRPAPPSDLAAIVRGALALDPPAVAQLGVVLLIATPIARVAFALAHYARRRDVAFATIAAAVLALLVGGIALG